MEEKENGSGTLTRLSAFLKGGKGTKIIVAVGLVGMGLILASNFWTPKSDKQVAAAKASAEESSLRRRPSGRLGGSIEGAGSCQVMVTLENGVEYVYATPGQDQYQPGGRHQRRFQ